MEKTTNSQREAGLRPYNRTVMKGPGGGQSLETP